MKTVFRFLAIALLAVSLRADPTGLTGRILSPVSCKDDDRQTYALYVPSNYTAGKTWPVIFCFDPGARGNVPVERLQAAAEKYGYIVAGSLTSRNGPWPANAAAIQAMVADVNKHLTVDPERIYTAGVSGGARVAIQVALTGLAKGVIACSAGFPGSGEDMPGKIPFVVFGTAGTEDFNFAELKRLDGELEDRKATHRIVIFKGGHEWAPAALLTEAVEWLELQAMRTGKRPRDEALVQAIWRARVGALPGEPGPELWRATRSLAADFKGLVDTTDYERRAKELAATRDLKDGLKAERALTKREEQMLFELGEVANEGMNAAMRKMITELRQKSEAPEDTTDRQLARRVIAGFASSGRDATRAMLDHQNYEEAALLLEMLAEFRPGQSRTYYDLARARGLSGDRKRAMEALRQAADAGFSDAARVEAEPAFAKIKSVTAFQEILEKIRANPPEPERPERR